MNLTKFPYLLDWLAHESYCLFIHQCPFLYSSPSFSLPCRADILSKDVFPQHTYARHSAGPTLGSIVGHEPPICGRSRWWVTISYFTCTLRCNVLVAEITLISTCKLLTMTLCLHSDVFTISFRPLIYDLFMIFDLKVFELSTLGCW